MTTETSGSKPILMTRKDVCRETGLTDPTIAAEVTAGRLVCTRIRRRTLFHREDFEAWLNECREISSGDQGRGDRDAA